MPRGAGVAVVAAATLAAAATCGGPRPGLPPPGGEPRGAGGPGASPQPGDPTGAGVTPRSYQLELAIDPAASGYTGTVEIELAIDTRTSTIWLDAQDLRIGPARLEVAGERLDLAIAPDPPQGRLGLTLPRAVGPAAGRLTIEFAGAYASEDAIFVQAYRARNYVFSDFEPIDARRAFPCFDEPRLKTPWTVSLVVPDGLTALGNMAEVRRSRVDADRIRVELATTPPLPTYLVAIAVGPFELVAAEGGPVPIRIAVPAGRSAAAARAAAVAPELLAEARELLDRDVPFAKLDFVAVPRFGGAMENPGLVTVAADILLDGRGRRDEHRLALVLAHEIAHLWFGDSVTLTDWRDLWLNEGFASWMADEVLARWRPRWATRRDEVRARFEAMNEDDLPGAHPLRPDVLDRPRALFDVLTYQKSAALLHMIEDWVGPDRFLAALRGYLDDHAFGSADTEVMLGVLGSLGDGVRDVVDTWLATAGVPQLDAVLSCQGGARLDLTNGGARVPVPACVRWHDGRAAHRRCVVVDAAAERLDLGARCPTWIHPNAGGSGYYRWTLTGAELGDVISGAAATDRERLDAARSIRARLAGGARLRELAAALTAAVRTDIPEVVEAAVADYELLLEQVAPDGARKAIAAHLRAALAPARRRLGTAARPGEPDDDRRLRAVVLTAAGVHARDARAITWARKAARRWLRDRTVPRGAELLEPALVVAAAHADDKLVAGLVAAAENAIDEVDTDPQLLARALGKLPRSRALAVLDVGLGGALPSGITFGLATELLARADTAPAAVDALARHPDWLTVALAFAPTCDPDLLDRVPASPRADPALTVALERRRVEATRCDALRERVRGAARAFAR
jgi:cytosol alanyl aminopeptidase